MDSGLKRELEDKISAGERLSFDDGVALYETDDLMWLVQLAHAKRTELNGDAVYFNVNRHLNMTNVCSASCAYCSFQRKPGEADAYTMRIEEAVRLAEAMAPEGLTELHIVNGLHPTLPWRYYPKSLSELRATLGPNVALKAFTATEIHWFERISGLSADEILDELIDAGLSSLTGGGAEIFDWDIRKQIVDHDTHWEDWSRIHRLAHSKGMKTPATMLYGHIEEPRHRVDHVLRLRELQDETLKKIAQELTQSLRENLTVDWSERESVRAKLRLMVKRILKKYKYPPDQADVAVELVLAQAQALGEEWTN